MSKGAPSESLSSESCGVPCGGRGGGWTPFTTEATLEGQEELARLVSPLVLAASLLVRPAPPLEQEKSATTCSSEMRLRLWDWRMRLPEEEGWSVLCRRDVVTAVRFVPLSPP